MMRRTARGAFAGLLVTGIVAPLLGQNVKLVEFPDPALFYQNTTFDSDGNVAYVPSFDNDVLWSFSLATGELLDPDGLAFPAPGTASDPFIFPNDRLAIPGWFPSQGILVADISDPTDLIQIGVIAFPTTTNIQGQNVEIDDNGVIGYVAGFPDDTLYSFDVNTLGLEDPNGLILPGNPDRIALAGDRLAIVDTTNGRIMVADVSNPADLALAGVITLPGTNTFGSNDDIVFAADGQTGFVSSNERVLHSFDVVTLSVLDPDGIAFGSQYYGDDLAIHGNTVACVWSRGLTFIDVSDPTDMAIISNANFGGTVALQGNATAAFTADGTRVAIPVVYPDDYVYTFEVATGAQVAPPLLVDDQPNYLTIFQPGDQVGVLCSGNDADNVWLIQGLFGNIPGDIDGDGKVDLSDLGILLATYNLCPGDPGYNPDANLADDGDPCINLADLGVLLANYGYGT
jgi:hypothetical protein